VVGVSKMSAGNYMQERYKHVIHVTRQNKGGKDADVRGAEREDCKLK
jgi:hypothetical protein